VLLLAEVAVWWLTSPLRKQDTFHSVLEDYYRHLANNQDGRPRHTSLPGLAASKRAFSRLLTMAENAVLQIAVISVKLLPGSNKRERLEEKQRAIRDHFATLQHLTTRNWLQRAFFAPLECFNMIWACYLIFAQTIGAFNNCSCMTSSWSSRGGYLDFTQFRIADSPLVEKYWIQGTVISCVVMGLGMGYIVLEVSVTSLSCHSLDARTDVEP
jgi:hypothetical protein